MLSLQLGIASKVISVPSIFHTFNDRTLELSLNQVPIKTLPVLHRRNPHSPDVAMNLDME